MKPFLLLCSIAVIAAAGIGLLRAGRDDGPLAARVIYVIDGDTVIARIADGDRVHVRLIGIDTPEIGHDGEPGECFGRRAAEMTRGLALGREVTLEVGRERHDRYGRLLAYLRVVGGPGDLELTLLERGAARTLAISPNTDRAAVYAEQERAARRAGRGLWGACP